MEITYLGHAGFCVETSQAILITDPWLSPHGAFDAAWFQFPRNHHLAPYVHEKLADSRKSRFVYVSHEHQDHFDLAFLQSIPVRDFTFIVPQFERPALRNALANLGAQSLLSCADGEEVEIPGGYLKLYLDDSGINRDSAILLKAEGESFLDMNDCKLYDQLPAIARDQGPITTLTCQFSGATWHPTCYDYTPETYARISQNKMMNKFGTVARAIQIVRPRLYLPSAGPACFLDPMLMHLNFERINIFPRNALFLQFLEKRLNGCGARYLGMTPGDKLDARTGEFLDRGSEKVEEENLKSYLEDYAARCRDFFPQRKREYAEAEIDRVLDRLRAELHRKLSHFELRGKVRVPLYFGLSDASALLRIDFPRTTVEKVSEISDPDYYSIQTPAWQILRVLDGKLTWEEFALTFRMRLNREPDIYQTLIQGFLLMEPEDMNWFCARLIAIEESQKRIVVDAGGTRYSIDRFCPHQGGDLAQGWLTEERLWTCPRHRWHFALDKSGRCTTSDATIHAVCLEGES